jgi:hypothetical protein
MRNLLTSSPRIRMPAFIFFLTGGVVAACSVPGTIDGPVGEDLAFVTTDGGFGGSSGTSVASSSSGGFCTADGLGCMLPSECCSGVCNAGVCGFSQDGGGGGSTGPIGFWQFDDCNASSTALADSSGFGNTATRTTSVACVPGITGLAANFDGGKDAITVANGASFTFTDHIAVAAWINPTSVAGTQTIVTQQASGKTTFSLSVVKGRVEFSVTLQTGKTVKSSAPLSANTWSHVAGSYDGKFVFLYLDGQQVGQVDVPGLIKEASGPIAIGNNAAKQVFSGAIDNVWISTNPVTINDIAQLACIHRPATFAATPTDGPPSPPDTAVDYSIVVTNNDAGFCAPAQYFMFPAPPQGFTAQVANQFSNPVPPGGSATFPLTVTSGEDLSPGVYPIPFFIQNFNGFDFLQGQVTYDLLAPTGCFVSINRELMIKDLSVVEDPVRTTWNGDPSDPRTGAWTFGALMQNLAPTPEDAPAMVQQMLNTWLTDQQVNGFTVPARPSIQQLVIDPWPKTPTGALDLTKAPLRLSAIVNRLDVRNLNQGKAGEGRFVFGVVDPGGFFPLQFTLIVEYELPATTDADVLAWANAWHDLGTHPFPSEEYNAALQALTAKFTGRGVAPNKPNGSALAQLRTNEIALSFEWELREFHLSGTTGFLQPAGVALTPDLSLNQTPTLADFVNQNQSAILTQLHTVPPTFEGQPFQGGSSLNPLTFWAAPGIANNDARQLFSLNTCNGCHGPETGTGFLHLAPRFPGQETQLSGFLTGITVSDPISGVPRTFGDLAARKADLTSLVCTPPAPAGSPAAATQSALIKKGRRQVH